MFYVLTRRSSSQQLEIELKDQEIEIRTSPIRSLIVTSWRSGSTFLGEILSAIPETYYYYEPLMRHAARKFNSDDSERDKKEVLSHIKKLLKCDFSDMEGYLSHARMHPFQFEKNRRLWDDCKSLLNRDNCFSPSFLGPYCKQFPFITMKIVRSNLEVLKDIIKDDMNVRILLLVRDPRPTLNSRWRKGFCIAENAPACGSPSKLCDQLVRDFRAAEQLFIDYPKRFMTIRYEDLALDLYEVTEKILSFFGLKFNEEVKKFLETHTIESKGVRR